MDMAVARYIAPSKAAQGGGVRLREGVGGVWGGGSGEVWGIRVEEGVLGAGSYSHLPS